MQLLTLHVYLHKFQIFCKITKALNRIYTTMLAAKLCLEQASVFISLMLILFNLKNLFIYKIFVELLVNVGD